MPTLPLQHEGRFEPVIETLNIDAMLRIHGYKNPEKVRQDIRRIAEKMRDVGSSLFDPVVFYRKVAITECKETHIELVQPKMKLHNPQFGETFRDCTDVVFFLLTLGEKLDEMSTELQQGEELLEAVFLETACWLGIEKATRSFVKELRKNAETESCRITRRFAPGYGEWNLSEQQNIFEVFSGWDINIRLIQGGCMHPKMSRSGMYGLRPNVL